MKSFDTGSTREHQELTKKFRAEVSTVFKGSVKTISVQIGVFRDMVTAERFIHSGETGTPDTIVFGKQWYLFFDTKTGKARFTKEQAAFKAEFDKLNDLAVVYKLESVEQGIRVIKNAKEFFEAR